MVHKAVVSVRWYQTIAITYEGKYYWNKNRRSSNRLKTASQMAKDNRFGNRRRLINSCFVIGMTMAWRCKRQTGGNTPDQSPVRLRHDCRGTKVKTTSRDRPPIDPRNSVIRMMTVNAWGRPTSHGLKRRYRCETCCGNFSKERKKWVRRCGCNRS